MGEHVSVKISERGQVMPFLAAILCFEGHYGWRSFSHENERANVWHNATVSVLQLWQRGEPASAGQCGRCYAILCRSAMLPNVSVNEVRRRPCYSYR